MPKPRKSAKPQYADPDAPSIDGPQWILDIAEPVHEMIIAERVMDHFREMISQGKKDYNSWGPTPSVFEIDGERKVRPHEAKFFQSRRLSIAERYVRIAIIHDFAYENGPIINPDESSLVDHPQELLETLLRYSTYFVISEGFPKVVKGISAKDRNIAKEWFREVMDHLQTWLTTTAINTSPDVGAPVPTPQTPTHSPDFVSVDWYGTRYEFSKGNQAQAVRVLWEAWKSGGHSLTQEKIGEKIESAADRFDLAKTFRKRKHGCGYESHPAWRTMIQQASKGSYRLTPPESA